VPDSLKNQSSRFLHLFLFTYIHSRILTAKILKETTDRSKHMQLVRKLITWPLQFISLSWQLSNRLVTCLLIFLQLFHSAPR